MARDRVIAAWAASALAVLALSGCGSYKPSDATCPKLVPAPGADMIALFGPGGHTANDVMVGGRFYALDAKCVPEKTGVTLNAEIGLYAQRSNMGVKDTSMPYFVALVDADSKVLLEQGFVAPIQFLPGEIYRRMPPEKITVHLPLRNPSTGSAYTVVVGFQLTPDQLAFNRAQHTQQ